MTDIQVCFQWCFYRTECHTTDPRPCDKVMRPPMSEVVAADPMAVAREALEALERVGCQFSMCTGPTLEPEDMITCFSCLAVAKLRTLLGMEVRSE